jgi:hypothetical protein
LLKLLVDCEPKVTQLDLAVGVHDDVLELRESGTSTHELSAARRGYVRMTRGRGTDWR